jgi:hypothetical protein
MKCIRTAMVFLATVLSATGVYSQTPNGAPERDFPSVQRPPKPSETTGAGTRPQNELGATSIVPADGATDRAPPSKLRPGELPTPQNPKAQ